MATINSCTSCGCNKAKCGCQDTMLTSPAPCPTPIGCPSPEPCSESFDAQCVIYTGTNIECNSAIVVSNNDTVADALSGIVDYLCAQIQELQNTRLNKFIRTFTSIFDGDTKTILGSDLVDCGIYNQQGCSTTAETTYPCDISIDIYFKESTGTTWYKLDIVDPTASGVKVQINNTTGDITINFGIAPIDPAATVRVVIIG